MDILELTKLNRSYRRFYEDRTVTRAELEELIDLSRFTPSGANGQVSRYMLFNGEDGIEKVFPYLRWAGFYKDWDGPVHGERPTGYIVILRPSGTNPAADEGIKGQTMLLGAVQMGYGGCFIGNLDRTGLAKKICVPEGYEIGLVLAIGMPKENVILHDVVEGSDLKYYRDSEANQHVPKLISDALILN